MRRAVLLALVMLVPVWASAAAAPHEARHEEEPWWQRTMLDGDGDRVDDALAPLVAAAAAGVADDAPLRVLVAYATHPGDAERAAIARAGGVVAFAPRHFPLLGVEAPASKLASLAHLDGVVLVEANDEIRPMLAESVPLIGAPQAWSRFDVRGHGVVVAVLDDGAYEQHPDLRSKVAASFNAATAGTPLTRVGGSTDVVVPAGENGHGTHVAGTIVGAGDQSQGKFQGVAPGARFVNVQVFTAPNRTNSDIVLRGLDWVISNMESHDIRIAQMSLGGRASDGTDALSRGVDIAVDKGLIVVAAAGNAGPGERTVQSPGAAEKAITVGAVDKRKAMASFSSRGPTLDGRIKPDLVAPGRAIMSTVPPSRGDGDPTSAATGGGVPALYYGSLSGTSMAAPHVAGVIALMLEERPSLGPHDVKRILLATAQDLGAAGADNASGYGFVNGVAAVQVANNPALLRSAQFRDILATIPEPAPESFMDRLSYDISRMQRDGTLPPLALVVLALALAGIVAALIASRRRSRGGKPPASPPPPE